MLSAPARLTRGKAEGDLLLQLVNDDVHELVRIRITRFAHKKQECLQHNKVNSSLASL